ncbi:MAG: hypothetical protein Q9204_005003 [Flavoplaca sp. TL-2023a]
MSQRLILYDLSSIDLQTHGHVVFKLAQRAHKEVADANEESLMTNITFIFYILGMSLQRLESRLREPLESPKRKSWIKFHEFLKRQITATDFETGQHDHLRWSHSHRNIFSARLTEANFRLDPALERKFEEPKIEFTRDVAYVFHQLVMESLITIVNSPVVKIGHISTKVPKRSRNVAEPLDDDKDEAQQNRKKRYHTDQFKLLVAAMQNLLRIDALGNALHLYTRSIKPPPRKDGDTVTSPDDELTQNQAINQEAVDAEYGDNEFHRNENNTGDDDTGGKSPSIESHVLSGLTGSPKNTYTEGERKWQSSYEQWIQGILSQLKAAMSLGAGQPPGHTMKIQQTTFTFITADPPGRKMEKWPLTINSILRDDWDTRDKVKEALATLRDTARKDDPFIKLKNENWKFTGAIHCEAMIACRNLAQTSMDTFYERNQSGASKIGVSKNCCLLCSWLLNAISEEKSRALTYRGDSGLVWRYTLPKDCPLETAKQVSIRLDQYLANTLRGALGLLTAEADKRDRKQEIYEHSSQDGSSTNLVEKGAIPKQYLTVQRSSELQEPFD